MINNSIIINFFIIYILNLFTFIIIYIIHFFNIIIMIFQLLSLPISLFPLVIQQTNRLKKINVIDLNILNFINLYN